MGLVLGINRNYIPADKKDGADGRDFMYGSPKPPTFPVFASVVKQLPDPWDQLNSSSCTGHGDAACLWNAQVKAGLTPFMPSRLGLYFNARALRGWQDSDSGALVRDEFAGNNQFGFADEKLWPFDLTKITVKPSQEYYDAAAQNKVHFYASTSVQEDQQIDEFKFKLALRDGYCVALGFEVYESFETNAMATTGIMPIPAPGEQLLGRHCVAGVEYDDRERMAVCRNSWGMNWGLPGLPGHFKVPYELLFGPQFSAGWMARLK